MPSLRWLSSIAGGILGLAVLGVISASLSTERGDSLVAHAIPAILQPGQKALWAFEVCNVSDTPRQSLITLAQDVPIVQIKESSISVPPKDCSKIDAEITAPSSSKWISIPILNHGTKIGQFGVFTRDPAALKLALSLADNSELVSIGGHEASLIVKDESTANAKSIPVSWRLEAGPWYSSGAEEFAAGSRTLLIPVRG
jgi:hypothetical protein